MADEVEAIEARGIGEREYVRDEFFVSVRIDAIGASAGAVAALVGRETAVTRGGELRHEPGPHMRRLREAMQQQHGLPGVTRKTTAERHAASRDVLDGDVTLLGHVALLIARSARNPR